MFCFSLLNFKDQYILSTHTFVHLNRFENELEIAFKQSPKNVRFECCRGVIFEQDKISKIASDRACRGASNGVCFIKFGMLCQNLS